MTNVFKYIHQVQVFVASVSAIIANDCSAKQFIVILLM